MTKPVGYGCSLKLQWLNRTVQLLEETSSGEEMKNALNEYLSYEIDKDTRLRKTREILMNIWYYDHPNMAPFRKQAISLIKEFPEYDSAIHLCMIYLAYPVVADVGRYMGKLFEYYDEITNTILRQKLYDEWGERGTLQTTSRRVTLTLKELGILKPVSRVRYKLCKQIITDDRVAAFLLYVAMKLDGDSYYAVSSLADLPYLFPFNIQINRDILMTDSRFILSCYDSTLNISILK